jgi:hypothetical protein
MHILETKCKWHVKAQLIKFPCFCYTSHYSLETAKTADEFGCVIWVAKVKSTYLSKTLRIKTHASIFHMFYMDLV